jgi:trans-aconitate 2-methyltransferase
MPAWDQDLYYRFRNQRTQPSLDLVARIEFESPARIVDLGCGPGNSTEVLRKRWPDAAIFGVDTSEEMLTAARKTDARATWVNGDIGEWRDRDPFNIVFSNAAIQWLPDHAGVIEHLFQLASPGGTIAVQIPDHYESALYGVLLEVSRDSRWNERMASARCSLTRNPLSFYYDALRQQTDNFEIWTTEYQHVLNDHEAILTFHRGTGMRPYLEALRPDEIRSFEQLVLDGYRSEFHTQSDGNVIFPFKRLFFIAKR